MSDTIADGKVVTFHYTLTNDKGETLDSSSGNEPLQYLHGAGNIVPGLEEGLVGKKVGEELTVVVEAKDGYGEYVDGAVHQVPRDQFPPELEIEPGMQFGATGPDGQAVPVWVRAVDEGTVTVDFNHPLAGSRLNFAVKIESVRDSSAEEQQHGHPHGPGGHHH